MIPLATVQSQELGGHDAARISQLALSLACAGALMLCAPASTKQGVWRWLILGLVVPLAILSTALAPDRVHAAREFALWIGLVPIALTVAGLLQVRPQAGFLISASATAIYASLVLILALTTLAASGPFVHSELFVGYDNRRFFNHVQTVALPLTMTAALVAESPRLRSLAWVGTIASTSLLLASGGRATALALSVGVVCAGLIFRRAALPAAKAFGLALVVGTAIYLIVFALLPALLAVSGTSQHEFRVERFSSDQSRLQLWSVALTQIFEAPWFGIGPMHYAHWPNPKAAHPHNVYLQVAAEWGMPMLLLLVGLAGRALVALCRAIQQQSGNRQRLGMGLLITWVAIAVDGVFSGNFVMPVSQVWIAFAAGWTWSWWRENAPAATSSPSAEGSPWLRRIAFTGIFLSQVWLCWSVWPELTNLSRHLEQSMIAVPNARTNPRFWSHGWF
jgi:O-antigen ligase